jgi:hypothetical protein
MKTIGLGMIALPKGLYVVLPSLYVFNSSRE